MLSEAIYIRARRPWHAKSGNLHAEKSVNGDRIIKLSVAIEIQCFQMSKSCVAHYFQGGTELRPDFRGKDSWLTDMRDRTVYIL